MRIIEVEEDDTCEVIIDDTKIEGFIYEDERCKKCGNFLIHYDKYDSFFCAYCNIWVESKCRDLNCEYYKDRPDRPL